MTSPPDTQSASADAFSQWLQERLENWLPSGAGADADRAVSVVLFTELELEDEELDLNEELDPVVWREHWSVQLLGQTVIRADRDAGHLSWDHALQEQETAVIAALDAGSSRADGAWAKWLDHWLDTEAPPRDQEGGLGPAARVGDRFGLFPQAARRAA